MSKLLGLLDILQSLVYTDSMNSNTFPMATIEDSDRAIAYATEKYIATYQKATEAGLSPNVADSVALAAYRSAEANWYAIHLSVPPSKAVA